MTIEQAKPYTEAELAQIAKEKEERDTKAQQWMADVKAGKAPLVQRRGWNRKPAQ